LNYTPSLLRDAITAAIAAADPFEAVLALSPDRRVDEADIVIAVGKASVSMALAMQARGHHGGGILVTPSFEATSLPPELSGWTHMIAGHPVPDHGSLLAGQTALRLAREMRSGQRLLVLLSGGASAMLEALREDVHLDDIVALNRSLLSSGLDIVTMNRLRTRLSAVKGGQLAVAAYPASTHALIVSDIPGDIAAFVGSGPTLLPPSPMEESDLAEPLARLDISDHVRRLLQVTPRDLVALNALNPIASTSQTIVTAKQSLDAAARVVRATGYSVERLGDDLEADATLLGSAHGELALRAAASGQKVAFLSGGETSVVVCPGGRGGRNKAYLLAAAIAAQGHSAVQGIAVDSDGIDGSEADAGAWFDCTTLEAICAGGEMPRDLLANSKSYDAFTLSKQLIHTGPTGTNVNDVRLLLVN
jgi:glycerate 2-kinase